MGRTQGAQAKASICGPREVKTPSAACSLAGVQPEKPRMPYASGAGAVVQAPPAPPGPRPPVLPTLARTVPLVTCEKAVMEEAPQA